MPTEPRNGWTFATLLRYVEALIATSDRLTTERFLASDRAVAAALASAEKAVNTAFVSAERAVFKAEEAQLRVNTGQNEWRAAMKDRDVIYATREQLDAAFARINILERGASSGQGRSGITTVLWGIGVSVLVGLILLAAKVLFS